MNNGLESDKNKTIEFVDKMTQIDLLEFDYNLLKANLVFLFDRDVNTAYKHVNECKRIDNEKLSWRYSQAFLDCYSGKIDVSYKLYKKILPQSLYDIMGVELYIQKVLNNEPHKIQFYFVLGLLNEFSKGDFTLANEYYLKFIKETENIEKYKQHRDFANDRMLTIETP